MRVTDRSRVAVGVALGMLLSAGIAVAQPPGRPCSAEEYGQYVFDSNGQPQKRCITLSCASDSTPLFVVDKNGVTVERCVQAPKIKKRHQPKFPDEARRQSVEGRVVLVALINRQGRAERVSIVHRNVRRRGEQWRSVKPGEDLGYGELAADAVRQWRYSPARLREEPVAAYLSIRIDFTGGSR